MRSYYSAYLMYTSFNWSLVLCRLAQQLKSIVDQCESRESVSFTFCRWSAFEPVEHWVSLYTFSLIHADV